MGYIERLIFCGSSVLPNLFFDGKPLAVVEEKY